MTSQYVLRAPQELGLLVARTDMRGVSSFTEAVPIARPGISNGHRIATAPYSDAAAAISWAHANGLSVDPVVEQWAQRAWRRELASMRASKALEAAGSVKVDGLVSTLMGHQEAFVEAAGQAVIDGPEHPGRGRRGIIDADEPGLGKTISALAALRTSDWHARRAIVICPTSLTRTWVEEMGRHFKPGVFTAHIATTTSPSLDTIPSRVDTIVIGWHILHAWRDTLISWGPDALVIDEGHYGKGGKISYQRHVDPETGDLVYDTRLNARTGKAERIKIGGSARADAVIRIGQAISPGGLSVALTGTPIINRPDELVALLDMVGVLHLFGGKAGFQYRFCDPQPKSIGNGRVTTDFSGASNLLELSQRLASSGHYIRRTKEHLVTSGTMSHKLVDGADFYDHLAPRAPWMLTLGPEQLEEYKEVEKEVADEYASMARRWARELQVGPGTVRVTHKVATAAYKNLTKITALRKAVGLAKVPTIIDWVHQKNQEGERVVVAAHHREVVEAYADALGGLKIQGGMSTQDIEDVKQRFNTAPLDQAPAIVVSIDAGKTGHTLCKQAMNGAGPECAWMIFAEQVWTPGDELQMHDRIWRIGQTRPVHVVNALARDSIDSLLYNIRAKKRRVYDAAINSINAADLRDANRAGAGIIAVTLAKRNLGAAP